MKTMKRNYTMDELGKVFDGLEALADARNDLYDRLSKHIGAFDKSGMSTADLAKHGCAALNLDVPNGQHEPFLNGYLLGRTHAKNGGGVGMDAGSNWLAKQSHATRG